MPASLWLVWTWSTENFLPSLRLHLTMFYWQSEFIVGGTARRWKTCYFSVLLLDDLHFPTFTVSHTWLTKIHVMTWRSMTNSPLRKSATSERNVLQVETIHTNSILAICCLPKCTDKPIFTCKWMLLRALWQGRKPPTNGTVCHASIYQRWDTINVTMNVWIKKQLPWLRC